jgi:hypothetical protein
MLSHHLEDALKDLRDIIQITESDIKDIKEAKNDAQFQRLSIKETKLKSFETKKAMIDSEISLLISNSPGKDLPNLLNEQQHKYLSELKSELSTLHKLNKKYARLVLAVSNLYNTFLERLVPTEMQGYNKVASNRPSILEIRA